jgi:hypothetical protein
VIVEGALRKWVFPNQQQLVYLVKDVWLLMLMVVYVARRGFRLPTGIRDQVVGYFTVVYIWWVILESSNPALPSLTLGLWGVRSHILYAALVWLIPAAFPSSQDSERWLRRLPQLAVPVLLLGILQFSAPLDSSLNRYAVDTEYVSTFGEAGAARVTGTFPYISGMTVFVFTVLLVSLARLLAGNYRSRWPDWLSLALAAAVVPMTGARWSVYVWALVLPVLLGEMLMAFRAAGARFARLALGLIFVAITVALLADQAITGLRQRARAAGDDRERIEQAFTDPMTLLKDSGLVGFGVGSAHQAADRIVLDREAYSWLPRVGFESEPGRLMLELGGIGFLLVLGLKVSWIVAAHGALRHARTHAQFTAALVALGFFVAHLVAPVVFNATAGAFYWGLAGALAIVLREQVTQTADARAAILRNRSARVRKYEAAVS